MDGSNPETIKCDDDGKEIQSVERKHCASTMKGLDRIGYKVG